MTHATERGIVQQAAELLVARGETAELAVRGALP
jgi:hypothetical protein